MSIDANQIRHIEKIVLCAIHKSCNGSTGCNVSVITILKKIRKEVYSKADVKKALRSLTRKKLIYRHGGRKTTGGATYGLTKDGKKLVEKEGFKGIC